MLIMQTMQINSIKSNKVKLFTYFTHHWLAWADT